MVEEPIEQKLFTVAKYRLVCQAERDAPCGCAGSGPWASSPDEAIDLAVARKWICLGGRWICPQHAKALEE